MPGKFDIESGEYSQIEKETKVRVADGVKKEDRIDEKLYRHSRRNHRQIQVVTLR